MDVWGFPGGTSGKEPICQCRRHKRCGSDPWVGKVPWRRVWQPTPVSLPGESHGQRSLAGYSPWGTKESDTTERLSTAQRAGRLMFSSLRLSVSRCSCVFLGAASWRLLRGGCSSGTMSACLLSRQLGQHVPALYHPFLTMWRCRCDHPFWKWPCMLWPSHSNPVTFEACPI